MHRREAVLFLGDPIITKCTVDLRSMAYSEYLEESIGCEHACSTLRSTCRIFLGYVTGVPVLDKYLCTEDPTVLLLPSF
jgi:hypothetical protein